MHFSGIMGDPLLHYNNNRLIINLNINFRRYNMEASTIQDSLNELGILNIEAAGEFSSGLVNDAIESTKTLFNQVDFDKLAKEIDKKEKKYK